MPFIYGVVAAISLVLLGAYVFVEKDRQPKFLLLFISVAIADTGYFLQSVSGDLFWALMWNRLSYLGSASSILMMLLIIMDACNMPPTKPVRNLLIGITAAAFLTASLGDWQGLYYREVSLALTEGGNRLVKEYGPLHTLYPMYLVGYIVTMFTVIVRAAMRRTISYVRYAGFLAVIVLGNVGVWLVEQLVDVDFEFLSVSYIVTELMLLLVYGILRDHGLFSLKESLHAIPDEEESPATVPVLPPEMEALFEGFSRRAAELTSAERRILQYYIDGHEIAEIPELACISINTVKKHNHSIYQKLNVTSRDELMLYIELFRRCGRLEELHTDEI